MYMELYSLVNRFITARTADGRAQRTLSDYRRVLDPFTQWCSDDSALPQRRITSLDGMTRETIREYVAYLRSKNWKESTVGIHIRNLRAFLR